jgi:hypothetical protein
MRAMSLSAIERTSTERVAVVQMLEAGAPSLVTDCHAAADTADRDAGDVGEVALDGDAGEEFHEFADGAAEHVAEGVGGEDVLDVGGEALLVGGDGLRVGLTLLRDHEGVEPHRAVGGLPVAGDRGQVDVLLHGAAGGHEDLGRGEVEVGEEHLERGRPARDAGDAVAAVLVGEDGGAGALHGDAGVGQVLAGADVEDAAGDGAGDGSGGGRRAGALGGGGRRGQEQRDAGDQRDRQVLGHGGRRGAALFEAEPCAQRNPRSRGRGDYQFTAEIARRASSRGVWARWAGSAPRGSPQLSTINARSRAAYSAERAPVVFVRRRGRILRIRSTAPPRRLPVAAQQDRTRAVRRDRPLAAPVGSTLLKLTWVGQAGAEPRT